MSTPSDQWDTALKAVLSKATTDADFRAKCLADPAGAARDIGVELPVGIAFSETPGTAATIVLPPLGSDPDEITDAETLADVAGGNHGAQYGNLSHPVYGGPNCVLP